MCLRTVFLEEFVKGNQTLGWLIERKTEKGVRSDKWQSSVGNCVQAEPSTDSGWRSFQVYALLTIGNWPPLLCAHLSCSKHRELYLISPNNFPGGSDGKSILLQCGRPRFNPWDGKISWRRKWQPSPVLLPGKSHGRRSLVGYSPWGHKELDMTEQFHLITYKGK